MYKLIPITFFRYWILLHIDVKVLLDGAVSATPMQLLQIAAELVANALNVSRFVAIVQQHCKRGQGKRRDCC